MATARSVLLVEDDESLRRSLSEQLDLHEEFVTTQAESGARALDDRSYRYEMLAASLAVPVFQRNPNHPGAPHYTIHAFDDPIHAPLALPAALRYAEIAPLVAHARHMPTHIFIQHGMWDYVSDHNQIAYDVARDLWEPGDSVGDTVHPLDWGQYGDLQLGDYAKAQTWIERLEMVHRESDGQARAASTLPLLNARYVVETEEWKVLPVTDDSPAAELLATGISAVKTGDLATAAQAEARLEALAESGAANEIMYREVAAMVRLARGQGDLAVALMDEAMEFVVGMRLPNGAASPVKPPYELYGEILLELDRPAEAVTRFKTSLERMPGRARSLLGLARAAAASGDRVTATEQYEKLRSNWSGREQLPGYQEASRFLQQTNDQ